MVYKIEKVTSFLKNKYKVHVSCKYSSHAIQYLCCNGKTVNYTRNVIDFRLKKGVNIVETCTWMLFATIAHFLFLFNQYATKCPLRIQVSSEKCISRRALDMWTLSSTNQMKSSDLIQNCWHKTVLCTAQCIANNLSIFQNANVWNDNDAKIANTTKQIERI